MTKHDRSGNLRACLLALGILMATDEPVWPLWATALGLQSQQSGPSQADAETSPEATPEIRSVSPTGVVAGSEVTFRIEGTNFSRGAYVSFSSPATHVVSTRRISAVELEAKVAIGNKAPAGTITLYVSNPAGPAAQVSLSITAVSAPPVTPPTENQPSSRVTPEVSHVEPVRAAQGSEVTVRVSGKNFAPGTRIAFSNPTIRVLETLTSKSTELTARIQVAPDAPVGKSSLFVVNPDDLEAEVAFEVIAPGPAKTTAPVRANPALIPATPGPKKSSPSPLHFDVFNLGDTAVLLESPSKARGTLTLAGGKLKYDEGGAEIFAAGASSVKEIGMNTYFGVETPVFHVILNSGKTFNFVAASLQLSDSRAIVDSSRNALRLH